jgi:hypothetical protein
MKSIKIKTVIIFLTFNFIACDNLLEEQVFSELTPDSFLNTEDGINSVLTSAYSAGQLQSFDSYIAYLWLSGLTSGEIWNIGGSIEAWFTPLSDFVWDSNHRYSLGLWSQSYNAIRDANLIIDNIETGEFPTEFKTLRTAEARFIRAWSYRNLYINYAGVPLYTSSASEAIQESTPRASNEDMETFIISELSTAIQNLPIEADSGRATKSAAMGVLCKFYLNTRRWQESADMAQNIMINGVNSLEADYNQVFSLENEGNPEILWALTSVAPAQGRSINALVAAPGYPALPSQAIYGARTYLFDDFVSSFEAGDTRDDRFILSYTSTGGEFVQLFGNDFTFPLKYEFDPNQVGAGQGNDMPVVRYSDILLSRAEALNQINGPTQESIDLINQVRGRANASLITLAGFTQEGLRDFILQERKFEFWFEGKTREDLLRHDLFISDAISRGKNAQPFHVLFPIPQIDIDANPEIIQNEGY